MTLLLFLIGFAPLACVGALTVRLLQGKSPVLSRIECLIYGSITGPTMVMIALFILTAFVGVPITLGGFLLAFLLLGILLVIFCRKQRLPVLRMIKSISPSPLIERWRRYPIGEQRLTLTYLAGILLIAWIAVKLAAGTTLLMMDPTYNDDVFNNWNYRAKVLLSEERLVLALPSSLDGAAGVSAYPPTVPLLKVWHALAAGGWNDRVIALASPLWYILALFLIWTTLKRSASKGWAMLAVYIASSLPLLLMHGSTPYADLFLALHICIALLPLLHALGATDAEARSAWLRLGAFALALLPMTKSEALLMHLPPILLLVTAVLLLSLHTKKLTGKQALHAALWYGGLLAIVLGPWLTYKYMNGLAFGNAKPIDTALALQPGALRSIGITWVLEANFLLLPGLLIALLAIRQRAAFASPLAILSLYIITVIAGLTAIFTLTGLSTEALRQTGSARGIVQLLPVTVILVTLLLRDAWNAQTTQK